MDVLAAFVGARRAGTPGILPSLSVGPSIRNMVVRCAEEWEDLS